MPDPEVFYLHLQGTQRGPYTIPQIDHLLNSGLIGVETLYWREGLEQWEPVTSLVRLRKKANPWVKPLLWAAVGLLLAVILEFFGSIAIVGWRETNQHDFTQRAAYWRARGVVRAALPPGDLAEFREFGKAQVEMKPPQNATVLLRGEISEPSGQNRPALWRVPMNYDNDMREWSGDQPQEVAP